MKRSEQEHKEDLSYLRAKLAQPGPELDAWLNGIVDGWIAARKAKRSRRMVNTKYPVKKPPPRNSATVRPNQADQLQP
jgi:hypothetical protein